MSANNAQAISVPGSSSDVDYLLSTQAVRNQCKKIWDFAKAGATHFRVNEDKLSEVAEFVAQVTRENYPQLEEVPYHSRWKHFNAGNVDRNNLLNKLVDGMSKTERVLSKIDLVVTSVLLDAGAGNVWRYEEKSSGLEIARSEGLAVASWYLFTRGAMSSDENAPLRVDLKGLQNLSFEKFSEEFQITEENPLAGAEGRFALLKSIATAMEKSPEYFEGKESRIGNVVFNLEKNFPNKNIKAQDVLRLLQDSLGVIWPGRVTVGGVNLGDAWQYPPLGAGLGAIVPFHKLSLWLTYSLVEPLTEWGFQITGFEELSGLPEYRNGGLFLDFSAIELRDSTLLLKAHKPSSEIIVEWRALTIVLLDLLAPLVRQRLGCDETLLPLGKILEGGTWAAGRKIAQAKRNDGASPLLIESDGTVF